MSYPLGHTAAGLLLYGISAPAGREGWKVRELALATFLANLPDLDIVVGLCLGNGNLFHRGPTHSLLFALLLSVLLPCCLSAGTYWRYWRRVAVCLAILLSHAALDGMIDHEHLAFFWPLQPSQHAGMRGFADTLQEAVAVSQKDMVVAGLSFFFFCYRSLWRNFRAVAGLAAGR